MSWTTYQQAMLWLVDYAQDEPLDALRSYADYLPDYALDACAIAEPAAALLYVHDRLTPERRAACEADPRAKELTRYFPDRLAKERLAMIRKLEGRA